MLSWLPLARSHAPASRHHQALLGHQHLVALFAPRAALGRGTHREDARLAVDPDLDLRGRAGGVDQIEHQLVVPLRRLGQVEANGVGLLLHLAIPGHRALVKAGEILAHDALPDGEAQFWPRAGSELGRRAIRRADRPERRRFVADGQSRGPKEAQCQDCELLQFDTLVGLHSSVNTN